MRAVPEGGLRLFPADIVANGPSRCLMETSAIRLVLRRCPVHKFCVYPPQIDDLKHTTHRKDKESHEEVTIKLGIVCQSIDKVNRARISWATHMCVCV